jgi:hypothetical protein
VAEKETAVSEPGTVDASSKPICFVVMPFSGYVNTYYENIYRPAIEAAGLIPRRADDVYRPSAIIEDIWELTKSAQIILADLTGRNPNVLYELGLAHAIAKPVVMVTQSIQDIPFDLTGLRIIEYQTQEATWAADLHNHIKQAVKEVLENPRRSVPATFLEARGGDRSEPVSVQDKELLDLRQEIHALRREVRTMVGLPSKVSANRIRSMSDLAAIVDEAVAEGSDSDAVKYLMENADMSRSEATTLLCERGWLAGGS